MSTYNKADRFVSGPGYWTVMVVAVLYFGGHLLIWALR